ncbi:hypothetical protein IMCC3317_30450 [Kordia antarctica]|uniref:Lipoprotein n=1 Tax=Kordia antarctica TaxID=1218801 RepID=A0A7L4ZP31_9FLAO|nr:hypothetical protein [Kordia antarctica]QHI37664.1 hypothetical protein IMCC3317_30450 [Kordia antarctica]
MKIKSVFLGVIFGFLALSCESKRTAEMIVNTSLEEAHGGIANWELPKTLIYEKTTILYDSSGKIESQKKQLFHNILRPKFTSKVDWKEKGIQKRIVFDGTETSLFFNQQKQTNLETIEKAHKEITGAQYVLWQPYKLLADEASLKLEGKVRLEDGSEAFKIKVEYPNSATKWWYYFDTETFLLKENLVKHGTTYSQIKNISHEKKTELRLHKERKSYWIDSIKNQKYLRAQYYYTILKLE